MTYIKQEEANSGAWQARFRNLIRNNSDLNCHLTFLLFYTILRFFYLIIRQLTRYMICKYCANFRHLLVQYIKCNILSCLISLKKLRNKDITKNLYCA